MNALIFCLGSVSAIVMVFIIAIVVMVLRLKDGTESLKADVQELYRFRDSDQKEHEAMHKEREVEEQNNLDSIYRELASAQESCNKYTDSRIDKLTEKLSKN